MWLISPLCVRLLSNSSETLLPTQRTATGPFQSDIIDKARTRFAICATQGIAYLTRHRLLDDTPADIADFLHHCSFLDRPQIGEYLSEPNHQETLNFYLKALPMEGIGIEAALRKFLRRFKLPGEAQRIDRLMEAFARHYCQHNPDVFHGPDTAYVLSFAMIMLNTDLHNPANPHRMTREVFQNNVRGIDDGADLSEELLGEIYRAIAKQELMTEEEELLDYTLSAPDIEGLLWKKSDRSTFYAWNRRWCVVANGCLYYFYSRKDKSPRGVIPLEDLQVRPLDRRGKFRFEITAEPSSACQGEGNELSNVPAASIRTQATTRTGASSIFAFSIDGDSSLLASSAASIQSADHHPSGSLPLIKSAKFVKGQLVEGKRDRYIFQCASEEERDRWMRVLNERMQRAPLKHVAANTNPLRSHCATAQDDTRSLGMPSSGNLPDMPSPTGSMHIPNTPRRPRSPTPRSPSIPSSPLIL